MTPFSVNDDPEKSFIDHFQKQSAAMYPYHDGSLEFLLISAGDHTLRKTIF
jgi:hypothetical protein